MKEPVDTKGAAVRPGAGFVQTLFDMVGAAPPAPRLPSPTPHHPLENLLPEEIRAASKLCKDHALKLGLPRLRFNSVALQEPPKAAQLQFEANPQLVPPRRASLVIQVPELGATVVEAVVDLSAASPAILSWRQLEGVHPTVTIEDCLEAEEIVKADAGIIKLLKERYGLTPERVAFDPWYYGDRFVDSTELSSYNGRFIQVFAYARLGGLHYAHPLDLVVMLDMSSRKIMQTFMQTSAPTVATVPFYNTAEDIQKMIGYRTGLKPLHVVQPEGPSFSINGSSIAWQKWHMRMSFNHREGLVLHNIGYEDRGRIRPVLHRASIVEIAVPYAEPRAPFHKKCAFDVVDYGLGYSCSSLELGCDCLGHIHYFDATLSDSKGEPFVVKKAVCLHEEDAGFLWKHVEYRTGQNEVRRSRRLVISMVATIANYEYGFYWYFYQDGTIQHETKLTGCLSTNVLSEGEGPAPQHGTLLAPGLNAQHHQHFFCARLDPAIDDPAGGAALTVVEVNAVPMPLGADNPHGVGWFGVETELETEQGAIREVDPRASRFWKIKNKNSRLPTTGAPVAWKLVPGGNPPMYAHPTSEHPRRAAFATKNLWVTPHSDDERYPAGDYCMRVGDTSGLLEWTALDRNVKDADVVLWHSYGVTHLPRPEDFPVMPVETVGFVLKPCGFFTQNPGMDIPPTVDSGSREHSGGGAGGVAACAACAPAAPASKM